MHCLLLTCTFLLAAAAEEGAESKPEARVRAPITVLAISPDGRHLLAGSQDGVRLFLLEQLIAAQMIFDGAPQAKTSSKPDANSPRRSLDAMHIRHADRIPTELEHIHDLCYSSQGDRLLLAGGSPGELGSIEIYAWPEVKLLKRATVHDDLIYGIDFDATGKWIATGSGDETAKLWRPPDLDQAVTLAGHSQRVLDVRFLPDGQHLVSVSVDQTIRVWSVESGKALRTLSNHLADVTCVEVRPQETRLPMVATAAADKTVRLWQPTIGRMVRFQRFETEPVSLAWNPDGRLLWIGMEDGQLIAMSPETAELLTARQVSHERLNQLAVSPDGKWVFVGDSRGQLFCISSQFENQD